MNLSAAMELQSASSSFKAAGLKQDNRFQPVHAGAHAHFIKIGYMPVGNKTHGGITTSHYFKAKGGNSRHVTVKADGSFIKTSQTAKGARKVKGCVNSKGMKCHNVSEEMHPDLKHEVMKAGGPSRLGK
jgi:hypothetical protein